VFVSSGSLSKFKLHTDCNDEHAEEEEGQLNATITNFNVRDKAAGINLKLIISAKEANDQFGEAFTLLSTSIVEEDEGECVYIDDESDNRTHPHS
jgi:hypothetical protein